MVLAAYTELRTGYHSLYPCDEGNSSPALDMDTEELYRHGEDTARGELS